MPRHRSQAPNRHIRKQDSFRRHPVARALRPIVLIVCEGEETEYRYFNAWRSSSELTTVTIDIHRGAGQDAAVVDTAIRKYDERKRAYQRAEKQRVSADPPFEEVWCVFDREGQNQTPHFWQAVARADSNAIKLAISNPCFEYWSLLHFRDTGEYFQDGQLLKRTLRQHIPDYTEHTDVFDKLLPLLDTALERAERHYEQHPDRNRDRYPNPSTTVYQLIRSLRRR